MTKKAKSVKLPRSVRRLFPQVEYAVDATKPVEVSVGKRDCTDAKKMDPMNCALARAAKRELHADGVIIGMTTSYVVRGKVATRFATPISVAREIVSFDRHNDFAEGDYHLTPKSPTLRFGVKDTRKKGGKHNAPKRKVHHSVRVRVLPHGAGE